MYLLRCSAVTGLVPRETAAVTVRSVYTTQARIMSRHFTQSHIRRVYACLAVTCHLRFRQNDRGLLRATAVRRGWNGQQHKSQHRKLTLEKNSLPLLLPGLEPATFQPLSHPRSPAGDDGYDDATDFADCTKLATTI